MTKEEHISYWISGADADLEVAEAMLLSRKNLWCLFITHLVIEKSLKAHFVNVFNEVPPRTHNLVFLAEKVQIVINESQIELLDRLNVFQISARYPDYRNEVNNLCSYEFTIELYQKSKELFIWIKSQLR